MPSIFLRFLLPSLISSCVEYELVLFFFWIMSWCSFRYACMCTVKIICYYLGSVDFVPFFIHAA